MHSFASRISRRALGVALCLVLAGPALADRNRFVVDLVNEPSSLDPQMQWNPDSYYVYRNIFDNLITRDDKGDIVPQIATSWKQLSPTEIEFQLRGDVTFHDGSKLTAEDVAYSVKRITDPKLASPQLGQFDKIKDAVVSSPTSVKLVTDGPYPALLAQLVKLSIVPKAIVEALGKDAFNLKPVGSGPYKFDGWQRGVAVTLSRNDSYWGQKGPFPVVVFRAVPDAATRIANLQSGTADLIVTIDSDQATQLKNSPRAQVLYSLTERVGYVRLNPSKPPFDNPKIRQALSHAIDRDAIVDGILGGFDKSALQMLTPAHFGYVEGAPSAVYDSKKAKALIAEAGAAAKAEIELATAVVFDQRIVQAIQQMLTEAGLNVKISMSDTATYLKRAQSGPDTIPALSFGRWSCACQDADGVLFPLLHKSSSWSAYRNAEADRSLEEARQTLDEKKRIDAYRNVHAIIANDAPLVPIYQAAALYGGVKNLVWKPTPNESMFLNRMSWKD